MYWFVLSPNELVAQSAAQHKETLPWQAGPQSKLPWEKSIKKQTAARAKCSGPYKVTAASSNVYFANALKNRSDNCVEIQLKGSRNNQIAIIEATLNATSTAKTKKPITLAIYSGAGGGANGELCTSSQVVASKGSKAASFVSCTLPLRFKSVSVFRAVATPRNSVVGTHDFFLRLSVRIQPGNVINLAAQ
ncbi:MAG: hypothetical protein ACR2O3_05715 [Rhizobiaceae bacterium]